MLAAVDSIPNSRDDYVNTFRGMANGAKTKIIKLPTISNISDYYILI